VAVSFFHRTLRTKIGEVLDTSTKQLASGICKDYAAYREEAGYLRGLMDALKLADDIEREPDERSDSA
jgi:hypothetical protein